MVGFVVSARRLALASGRSTTSLKLTTQAAVLVVARCVGRRVASLRVPGSRVAARVDLCDDGW